MIDLPEIEAAVKTMKTESVINILLVDDRKEDMTALELLLKQDDYNFVKAPSGRDALRVLMKEQDFALILMDVNMPLLDGFETASLIRENDRLKHIPIIFLTANNDRIDNVFRGYKSGAVDYIIKPVIPEIIKAKVSVFSDLYRKTLELQQQKKNLLRLNAELEKRTIEIIRSNKELEKFAYVASHDMQEPLRTIISYVQLMEEKLNASKDEETTQYMEYVVNAGYRMRDLITGLLEYSRINRNEMPYEQVDCNIVLDEVVANLGTIIAENRVVLSYTTLPVIKANRLEMLRLLQNLISNAIKFNKNSEKQVRISYKRIAEGHQFSIEDNGIGIDQHHSDKIFEIFKRLHPIGEYQGTGIGLAICKKIIERYGGKIWVESVADKGSTFHFTIPDLLEDKSAA